MEIKKLKNYYKNFYIKLKQADFKLIYENLKNFKLDDFKNINYKLLFKNIYSSPLAKPVTGLFSASMLLIFLLLPKLYSLNSSLKKVKLYEKESSNLPIKIAEFNKKNSELQDIKIKMLEIDDSFLKKENIIYISQLINKSAQKANVKINFFAPINNANSSKLCKSSIAQTKSKKFSKLRRKKLKSKNNLIEDRFYEVNFVSDYLDIIQFLNQIQLFDVTIIPYCLEVNGKQLSNFNSKNLNNDITSIITPLNKLSNPIQSEKETIQLNKDAQQGLVETRIVLQIPSFTR